MSDYADPKFNKVYKHEHELKLKWNIRETE